LAKVGARRLGSADRFNIIVSLQARGTSITAAGLASVVAGGTYAAID
jgi:hypothetical protein